MTPDSDTSSPPGSQTGPQTGPRVLVVDLDGTLTRWDMLYEGFWAALSMGFQNFFAIFSGLPRGKAALKESVGRTFTLDPATLDYNENVLEIIRDHRAAGGRAVLATAADRGIAEAIAAHLGVFDAVHASDGTRNLKGPAKAAVLVETYGPGGYDYIGDSRADLPVWKQAHRAITVGASDKLRRRVDALPGEARHIGDPSVRATGYVRALRPVQWLKNTLVFLPLLAAHDMSGESWGLALMAFAAFSLVASSVYVLNDLLDLASDRAHPRKRARPFASGAVPLKHGTAMAPALLLAGLLIAAATGDALLVAILVGYYTISTAYSISLKRLMIIDICILAMLYTTRIFTGAIATDTPVSVWLIVFSIFIFTSLAAVKRQAELVGGGPNVGHESSRRAYQPEDLPIISSMAMSAGYVAVLVLALYLNSDAVRPLYSNAQFLWIVCPVLLFWISRVILLAHRGRMTDDPIIFAVRDRASQLCGVITVCAVIAGSVL